MGTKNQKQSSLTLHLKSEDVKTNYENEHLNTSTLEREHPKLEHLKITYPKRYLWKVILMNMKTETTSSGKGTSEKGTLTKEVRKRQI